MKRFVICLFLLAAILQQGVSQDKSFIILGDTHFDRMDLHDWPYIHANYPNDSTQMVNYSKITATNLRDLITEVAGQARTFTPAVRGMIQLGDFQEGLAGTDALALRMAHDVLDTLRTAEFIPPWILTKGNHDITGPGSVAAYNSVIIPFIQSELGQPVSKAYYSYRVEDVEIFVADSWDMGNVMPFLRTGLAASTAKYKIFTTHMPVVPVSGRLWNLYQTDDVGRDTLMNLLAQYKVLVLCGHLHKYSVLRRMTANGPLVQIMAASVMDDRNQHSASMTKTYGPNLVDLEPSFDPSTAASRKLYLANESKYITDFRMSDQAGYGILSLNSASGTWSLKYYGGLGRVVMDSVNLSFCRLKMNSVGQGSVKSSPQDSTFMTGSQVTITAVPALGWKFTGWSGAASGTANPVTVTMSDDKEVTATFEPIIGLFELRMNIDGQGTVQISLPGPYYTPGTKVTFTATPDAGQKFVRWSGDTIATSPSITLTAWQHKNITAVFATIQTYKLSTRSSSAGSIAISPAGGVYTEGVPVVLTASGSAGWSFYQWTGDMKGNKNPDTVVVNGNKEIRALYQKTGKSVYELNAVEDTYIRGGIAYQGRNFNTDPYLLVREGTTTMNQSRAYLKFDAKDVRGNVQAAWLKLHVTAQGLPDGVPVKAAVYTLGDDSWSESLLKWTGAPPAGTLLDSTTTLTQPDMDYAFDVTSFVQTKMAGTKIVSLAVKDQSVSDKSIQFGSREGTDNPKLVVATDNATGVTGADVGTPKSYGLHQAFPNPFNPSTTIGFDVAAAGEVQLNVYDLLGKQVALLVNGRLNSGTYRIQWDASRLASALYVVRLSAGGAVYSEKILLAK